MLQPINNAFSFLRTWVSGPQREVARPGSQGLGFRTSTRGFRTWLPGPGFQALNARFQDLDIRTWVSGPQREVSGPGSQDLGFRPSTRGFRTWISGPGFQALNARFQDLDIRTWVSGPQREVSGPRYSHLIYKFTTSVCALSVRPSDRAFCVLIHRQNRPGQSDGQTDFLWENRPGQTASV